MGGCQNYGPFLGPEYSTAPIIQGTPTGTLILTTTHESNLNPVSTYKKPEFDTLKSKAIRRYKPKTFIFSTQEGKSHTRALGLKLKEIKSKISDMSSSTYNERCHHKGHHDQILVIFTTLFKWRLQAVLQVHADLLRCGRYVYMLAWEAPLRVFLILRDRAEGFGAKAIYGPLLERE